MQTLSERISYLPSSWHPLSSDVGFIHGDKYEWIFDVGCNSESLDIIQGFDREKKIILSHFHKDHTDNIEQIQYSDLYCGSYTCKKVGKGIEVHTPLIFDDGVKIKIFPIPSIHSKGTVILEVNEEFAFLGDAVYGAVKNGKKVVNVNLLKEMISVLSTLKAEKFLLSHDKTFVKSKEAVISKLNNLYQMRKPGETYLNL